MFIGPVIPFTLLVARDSRADRAKYLRWARQNAPRSDLRKIDMDLAQMYKRHEKAWLSEYQKDLEIAKCSK